MKKIFALTISCLFLMEAFATDNQQEIRTPVQSAIVYLNWAEVTQSKQVTLEAGRNLIVFVGLSQKLVSKSVQVNIGGDVAILSVSDEINYFTKQEDQPRVKQVKDSVQNLTEAIIQVKNDKDAFDTEKKLMLDNKNMSGKDKALAVADLKAIADFYRARIKEINDEIARLEKKENKLNESLYKAKQQLVELNAKFNMPMGEVTILLSAPSKTTTTVELKYIVTDAGWAPDYDLKAEDVSKPIELKYRAKVFNNTGIDWTDVKLRLSTGDPMRSASKPKMDAWYLNYMSNENNYSSANYNQSINNSYQYSANAPASVSIEQSNAKKEMAFDQYIDQTKKPEGKPKSVIQYEQIQVSELSADFDIKLPYSIPADSKPYIVDVTTYNLPATYKNFCAPKIDKSVYLLARITGWEDLDLVEGPANVYYGGTYVGQSYINTRSVDDTLDLSLGRDNKVIVTRNKQKDFTSHKFVGSTKKELYAYEIAVKNNRKTPVQIEIEDQLPVSQQSDIIVEEVELSKAEKNVITGQLSWKYNLQPDELKKINLSFSIKYPKTKSVTTQQMKMAVRAKF